MSEDQQNSSPSPEKALGRLREEIADLDGALLELLERRFNLAAEVGNLKAEMNQPVVVHKVEQRVLSRARQAAEHCGISIEVMESIFTAIINASVERQHRVGVKRRAKGGAQILILGAAGGMGVWLRHFLEGIGHTTTGVDPAWRSLPKVKGRYGNLQDVEQVADFDALFVSVPLESTASVLQEMIGAPPGPPIFEITSIKSHLKKDLDALRKAGTMTISLHPMFGPSKNPYEPLTMVHAVGENEALERRMIQELLAHPYLDLVSLPFDRHDQLMGWLLGMAHLTGMLFASALTQSGLDPQELGRAASTTFIRQVATARSVLEEDPHLYFAIQRLNPFRGEVYEALSKTLRRLTGLVENDDRDGFATALLEAMNSLPKLP
ncbi:MAG: prephenate dehydrogenase/arogenate dehydrogenase family protein [Candidatus Eisenbacteria bacterium]|uniref:Prephenate dehydrogenase/arogenate dehydrogenase family protein n=1 Tax=Eiseniibacteriota bacterium TaxID=2212470 RepID=A0A948RYP8_UNCEI|nr:prephenate dehydrogenase/arogenate dehydrogenase family protein [Candidatus Eisenbacteria bacterium]MBU1948154.1 prephenate dehydrogenase/arogenate dehydrogenase family protein [Candidatus Eisenbacteria bacterium]MBU2690679.1 prephenate dehydrogenase/arogenate dehydrogenase family protein [Candidatus Eisenbacteria bacterium]